MEAGIGIPGSRSEFGHPEAGEVLRGKGPDTHGLHLLARKGPSQGCRMPGEGAWGSSGGGFLPFSRSITRSWQPSPTSQVFTPVFHSRGSSEAFRTASITPLWQLRAGTPAKRSPAPSQPVTLGHLLRRCPLPGRISHIQGSRAVTPRRISTGVRFMIPVRGWR